MNGIEEDVLKSVYVHTSNHELEASYILSMTVRKCMYIGVY